MSKQAFSYAASLRPAFLAHMANRLDALICKQTKAICEEAGVKTPARSISVMVHLLKNGPASIADIARTEGQSHQLVSSRTAPLEKLGLIKTKLDPDDERCRLLALTSKGAADAKKVEHVCKAIARSLDGLNKELDVDLMAALEQAETRLADKSISARINESGPSLAAMQ